MNTKPNPYGSLGPTIQEARAQAKIDKSLEKMDQLAAELLKEFKRFENSPFVPKFRAEKIKKAVDFHAQHVGTWPQKDLIGIPASNFQQCFDEQTINYLPNLPRGTEKPITCLDDFVWAAGYDRGENNEMVPAPGR